MVGASVSTLLFLTWGMLIYFTPAERDLPFDSVDKDPLIVVYENLIQRKDN
jgi:hypothetical protein